MDAKIKRVYVPMTETGFYILFCLQEEMHGYNITQKVKEMTEGQVEIGPGTMYGSLGKMEKDGRRNNRLRLTLPLLRCLGALTYLWHCRFWAMT